METEQKQSVTFADVYVKNRVRTLYLAGKEIKEIQEIIGMNPNTWESAYYMNTHSFREFFLDVKKQKMINDAERVSNKILSMEADGSNAKILSIIQKEAEFVRETQGKDMGYSKRIETIGLNINKTEPLDADQKEKLNKLLKKTGNTIPDNTDVVNNSSIVDDKL